VLLRVPVDSTSLLQPRCQDLRNWILLGKNLALSFDRRIVIFGLHTRMENGANRNL
jgi:hypothetical protein